MRIHDGLIGSVLLLLSLAVLWSLPGFPEPVGQPYGAALFPGLIAGGLALCSVALIVQGFKKRMSWIALGQGLKSPRHVLGFVAVLTLLALYILFVEALGFLPCALVMLSTLMPLFGVKKRWVLPIALVATLTIHTAFYKLLRVPLPWGLLESWAW